MNSNSSGPVNLPTVNHRLRAPGARQARRTPSSVYDDELVRRFNRGDESAFREIMIRHRGKTFTIARELLHNRSDAEEITQDTFVRAYRGLATFRGDSSLATWLYRIAVNLARNRYWYNFRRRGHAIVPLDCPVKEDSDMTLADLVAASDSDPARTAALDEFAGLVESCLQELSPSRREILKLSGILHQSYGEIARVLGVKVGTVKSRIFRARECLRTLLAQRYSGSAPDDGLGELFETVRSPGHYALAVA